jgi:hypothetical protein
MRVFVAGATGAIGKQLVPRLVAAEEDPLDSTPAVRRGGGCGDDDRRPWLVEREGQARAGVAPGAPKLA